MGGVVNQLVFCNKPTLYHTATNMRRDAGKHALYHAKGSHARADVIEHTPKPASTVLKARTSGHRARTSISVSLTPRRVAKCALIGVLADTTRLGQVQRVMQQHGPV